jgi:outer membrane protein insertion porin family
MSGSVNLKIKKYIFCGFYFLIFFSSFCGFLLTGAYGSVVGEIEVQGLSSMGKEELLYLLDIKPGATVDAEQIRTGIKRAFLKGIFEDIAVETTDGEKVKVIIHIKEKISIKSVYLEGDYAVSGKTIRKLFSLKEDQFLVCHILDRSMNTLKEKLALLGFPHADIRAETERLKTPYRINIHLRVNTGEPERIKKMDISGPAEEIKSVMKLSVGDIYDQTVVKKDMERIKAYYQNRGYYKPVLSAYTFLEGVLSFSVNPGKRLQISIQGNDSVSTGTLMKEMPFFETEDVSDDIVEEAVSRLASVYHAQGCPLVQIAPVVTSKDDLVTINFFIYEGTKVAVRDLSFHGNSIKSQKLKEIMSLKEGGIYNPDLIDADREALKNFYNALGYLSVSVETFQVKHEEGSDKVDIVIQVDEGRKTTISTVTITGTDIVAEQEIRKTANIHPGDAYNEIDLVNARYRIIDFYNSKGFLDVTVDIKRDFADWKASVTFQIKEGLLIVFGKMIVAGNQQTKYRVVQRELLQQEDKPFNYSLLSKEKQKLYKLGLFSDIDMEALDTYDDKKDVLVNLQEGDAGAVELSLGYAEYERYRGILDLSYRNFMGMNRQGSIKFELSSLAKRYVLQYYEPWFLSKELPFRAFIIGEDRKEVNIDTREILYRLIRHTVTAGFEKKISDVLKSELYYEFSLVNTFHVKPDVVLSREDTGTLVISGLRLGLIYDTRDNQFYPKKGMFSGLTLKSTSPVFLSETDFIKLTLYNNVYHELKKGLVLAASLRGGIAQGYLKTNELPIVERFFLGGRDTVRGYDQDSLGPKGSDGNPVGGNAFLMENLELRTSLGKGLGLVTFLDGGNVWLKINNIDLMDVKFTAGLGLRYNTPVGPVSIDYGRKLQREKGESHGAFHFSIGNAF